MTVTHDTLVYLAKTFGLFWMMAFFVIVAVIAYLPSRKPAYDRAARSILPSGASPERGPRS